MATAMKEPEKAKVAVFISLVALTQTNSDDSQLFCAPSLQVRLRVLLR